MFGRCYSVSVEIFPRERLLRMGLGVEEVLDKIEKIFMAKIWEMFPRTTYSGLKRKRPESSAVSFQYRENKISFEARCPVGDVRISVCAVVEALAAKTVLRKAGGEIKRIHSMRLPEKEATATSDRKVLAEGDGVAAFQQREDHFDVDTIYTNDIHEMLAVYGIEAANCTIQREVTFVFDVYGIKVDKRHLSLISDHMTFGGDIQSFSRNGIHTSESPIHKVSFEMPLSFLKEAALLASQERLEGPAGCILAGRPINTGTGLLSLRFETSH
ncbi:MAG: DNA-directed RNA polymerase I subunit RPA1 [Amphiamblys sp. WSBS2006]|nr:MAG: DNA-directed RNA polymerase I subunit RPA1 [Amphiamblys sp. WSBS2006]